MDRVLNDQARRRLTDYGTGQLLETYKRLFAAELEEKLIGKIRQRTPMIVDNFKSGNDLQRGIASSYGSTSWGSPS